MSTAVTHPARKHAEHAEAGNRTVLGFWIYLMTDCVLFASLFATYAVMRTATNGGPGGAELFNLPFILVETMILLVSSFTCGMTLIALQQGQRKQVLRMLAVTLLLGAAFVAMELYEFYELIHEGHSWQASGFLSSYFTLVGTHGLHIIIGILWGVVLGAQIIKRGLTGSVTRRMTLFGMFWHFLDVVWIFIFSIVYLWSGLL